MQQSQSSTLSLILFTISLLSTTSALPQYVTTEAPVATSAAVNWETAVTWPAGCETWLNPCPAGAITSGVAPTPAVVTWPAGCQDWANPCPASAIISQEPYTNPFTSYTTMTNSAGIITGMPPVATSAGGAASVISEQSAALATSAPTTMTASGESSSIIVPTAASATESASATTDNGFSQATFTGLAVANRAGAGVAVMAMGLALVL